MADVATLPLELTISTVQKKGSRHSSTDYGHLKTAKSHAKKVLEHAQGVIDTCDLLGIGDDDGGEAETPAKTAPAAAVPPPAAEVDPNLNLKALSLDKLVGAVSDAVSKLNRSGYGYDSIPYEQWCQVAGVYEGYVIVREGLGHWKASYTIGEKTIDLAPRAEWEAVECAWTSKAIEELETIETDEIKSRVILDSVKSVKEGRLGHYAVMWGGKDLYREHFDKSTEELDVIFKGVGKVPVLYQHAMDDKLKTSVVGLVDTMTVDDVGLWVETQLDLANQYATAIQGLAEAGKLGTSTGTLPGARKVAKSGYIERWPIAEVSLTPTPAEPRMRTQIPVAVIKAAYQELGLEFPDQIGHAGKGAEEARRQEELELERERLALLQLTL